MIREMAGRRRPRTRRAGQAVTQQTPPEPQQAPQYLVDLMAPLVARIAAIEELVANHITPPPPPVAETAISQENGTTKFQKDEEGSAKRGHAGDKGKNKRPLIGSQ